MNEELRERESEFDALHKANRELSRHNAELEELVLALGKALQRAEAVSQLTLGSVHDFRNALSVIQGETVFLSEQVRAAEQLDSLKAIEVACQQAAAIARDMLARMRGADSKGGLVDGAELVARCQGLISRVAKGGILCVFDLPAETWPVAVEAHQLEAALVNLSANARDAMPYGGELRISVQNVSRKEEPVGEYVSFVVQDNGTGMTQEVLARATEPFFTTKGLEKGTGLGLAMVQAFVTAARGRLRIESELGRGTRIELLLPRAVQSVPPLSSTRGLLLTKIAQQIQTPWLRRVLEAWRAACPELGLPRPARVEVALAAHGADCIVLEVSDSPKDEPTFRLLRIGDRLLDLLESAVRDEQSASSELLRSLAGAYRGALSSGAPSYEYVRYAFGDDPAIEFERLILPASAGSVEVTHLFGVVIFKMNDTDSGG